MYIVCHHSKERKQNLCDAAVQSFQKNDGCRVKREVK